MTPSELETLERFAELRKLSLADMARETMGLPPEREPEPRIQSMRERTRAPRR